MLSPPFREAGRGRQAGRKGERKRWRAEEREGEGDCGGIIRKRKGGGREKGKKEKVGGERGGCYRV